MDGTFSGRDQPNGPDVDVGDGRGAWKASSAGLKVLKFASAGVALGDLDRDRNLEIVAAGNITGDVRDGYGLFWFRDDGKGDWRLVQDSALPTKGLSVLHSIAPADLDRDGPSRSSPLTAAIMGAAAAARTRRVPPRLVTQRFGHGLELGDRLKSSRSSHPAPQVGGLSALRSAIVNSPLRRYADGRIPGELRHLDVACEEQMNSWRLAPGEASRTKGGEAWPAAGRRPQSGRGANR
jgi:hypothetical protein